MAGERTSVKSKDTLSNLKGDYGNIAFLLLLYILQGIPIGLSSAIPLLLQNRKFSYSDQALFSFVTWPFSIKLLWAPIVDSVYWRRMGRRKSWLVPVQLGIGLFMMILSQSVDYIMNEDPTTGHKPNIFTLTVIFLMLNFLAATQDIAVDGWALTMLSRRNVGYASACNTAGQTAGYFIGNVIFIALESSDFCNKYLRSANSQAATGIVTLEAFLHYCGIVFLVITILVALLKGENKSSKDLSGEEVVQLVRRKNSDPFDKAEQSEQSNEKELSIRETYRLLYKIIKLPNFKLFALILLTSKIGFSAPDAVSGLKLIEAGVKKENLALLAVPMVPVQIFLPWVISRMTRGPRPLDIFIRSYSPRLLFGLVFPLIVYFTPQFKLLDETFPNYYYLMLVIVYALHQVTVYAMFVSIMAFHASVSDPSIGGTYMTLLNTITNLGGNWPSTVSLWLVDKLTVKNCSQICKSAHNQTSPTNITDQVISIQPNIDCSKECSTSIDGYYIECLACVIFGFVWLRWGNIKLQRIQSLPPVAWCVAGNKAR